MKKTLLVLSLFMSAAAFAQKKDDAPAAAKAAFAKAYPAAAKVNGIKRMALLKWTSN